MTPGPLEGRTEAALRGGAREERVVGESTTLLLLLGAGLLSLLLLLTAPPLSLLLLLLFSLLPPSCPSTPTCLLHSLMCFCHSLTRWEEKGHTRHLPGQVRVGKGR